MQESRTRRAGYIGKPWLVIATAFVGFLLACSAWSLATPISGGPDEVAHITKAAASARGMWTGADSAQPGIEHFVLPADVSDVGGDMSCFAFHPEMSAACAPTLDDAPSTSMVAESGVGSYNPLYYVLVGWPTLFMSGEPAVYAVRLMSSLLTAVCLTLAFWSVRRVFRSPYALLIAVTPMVYFLGGVVNPNGLETSAVAAFVALLWFATSRADAPRSAIIALATTAAVVANLRATSPLYLVIAAIVVATAVGWPHVVAFLRRRGVLAILIPALVVAVLGVVWTLRIGINAGFIPSSDVERDGPLTAFLVTISKSVGYGRELIGIFGWLDTLMPEWIYVLWTAVVGLVIIVAISITRGRHLLAVALSLAALTLVPALVQAPTTAQYGYIWQGRYSLPLYVTVLLVAGLCLAQTLQGLASRSAHRVLVVLTAAVTIAQAAAFFIALRRYVVGLNSSFIQMFGSSEWEPPGGWPTSMALFLTGIAAVAIVIVLPQQYSADASRSPDELTDSPLTAPPVLTSSADHPRDSR
jgi:hypothetical protein